MSIWDRARIKAQELFGRAEQVYGESHGDAAATVAGEGNIMEAEAQAEQETERPRNRPDDDGPVPAR